MRKIDKKRIFDKTLFLHKAIARIYGKRIFVGDKDAFLTKSMGYDTIKETFGDLYEKYNDYTRYRTMELVSEELKRNLEPIIFKECCMAEAGVYIGDFAWILNYLFPDSKLYLYDTFEGFDDSEVQYELENLYTDSAYMKQVFNEFSRSGICADDMIEMVKSKMKKVENVFFRKGLFPASTGGSVIPNGF